jgi:hypothetical protein
MSLESEVHDTFSNCRGWPDVLSAATRQAVAACPAVYAITTALPFGRLRGTSDILYIGQTRLLGGSSDRARLYAYRYSPSTRDTRIRHICAELVAEGRLLTFRWRPVSSLLDAQSLEARLLALSYSEHLELPPMNHATPRA